MKYILTIITLLNLITFNNVIAQDKQPKLVFEGKRILNIGDVIQGDTVRQEFIIKNEGNAPLVILDIGKSCTCTDVEISSKIIHPQKTATITVVVATKAKNGTSVMDVLLKANTQQKEHIVKLIVNVVKPPK